MPVPPQDMDRIEAAKNVKLVTMSGTRIITLQLNQNRVEAFKDPRVRQAIVYAINNDGIAKKLMKGRATVGAQNSPQGYAGHNPALTPRYDLNKAKALMKDAGYATCIVGKWQLNGIYHDLPGNQDLTRPYGFGFDEYSLWQ